jgi:aspergillopepsin I
MFTADGYAIGGKNGSGSITGIADTGTTLLLLDASIVTAYYASVSGALYNDLAVGFVFPCDATLPDFSISVGGETRTGTVASRKLVEADDCSSGLIYEPFPCLSSIQFYLLWRHPV